MSSSPAQFVTFFSYKGGTGRSMCLANVAWVLASNGRRVLVVDWDLEAPGLHRYFAPFLLDPLLESTTGVIDFVREFEMEALAQPATSQPTDGATSKWFASLADLRKHAVRLNWPSFGAGCIDFVPAGKQGAQYSERVNSFDWKNFYERLGGGTFLDAVREALAWQYDYVLIDSRTGVSDTAGICTVQLPDTLVVCFTANNQSIDGSVAVAASVREHWRLHAIRPGVEKRILPVLTRIDEGEKDKLRITRKLVQMKFADFVLHIPEKDRLAYWGGTQIPYQPYYAYEEVLASFADEQLVPTNVLAAAEHVTRYITRDPSLALVAPDQTQKEKILARFTRADSTVPQPSELSAASPRSKTNSLALALSGGGPTAAAYHLGVLRLLYDAKLLSRVTCICAVSGGSIAAAHLLANWKRYTGSSDEFESASDELFKFITSSFIRKRAEIWDSLLAFRSVGRVLQFLLHIYFRLPARADPGARLLEDEFKRLFGDRVLKDLAIDGAPALRIIATSLTNGARYAFSQREMSIAGIAGERVTSANSMSTTYKTIPVGEIPVALAVAASSASVSSFPPIPVTFETLRVSRNEFPVAQRLCDGGLVDPIAVDELESFRRSQGLRFDFVLVSDGRSSVEEFDEEQYYGGVRERLIRLVGLIRNRVGIRWASDNYYVRCRLQDDLASARFEDFEELSASKASNLLRHGYKTALGAGKRAGIPEFVPNADARGIPPFDPPPGERFADGNQTELSRLQVMSLVILMILGVATIVGAVLLWRNYHHAQPATQPSSAPMTVK